MKKLIIAAALSLTVVTSCRQPMPAGPAKPWNALVVNAGRTSRWILRQTALPENKRIVMQACRNGHDGFQLAVTADGTSIANVDARLLDALRDTEGNLIPAASLRLYRELFLFLTTPTGMHPEAYPEQEIPDPLLPFRDPYAAGHPACGAPFNVGRIGSVGKSYLAVGDGGCFTDGLYTGTTNRHYVVEIDGEGELGEATFRWSDMWDGKFGSRPYQNYVTEPEIPSWKAERLKTGPGATTLDHGIAVRFTGGKQVQGDKGARFNFKNATSFNFHKGDRYYFHVYNKCNDVIWGDLQVPASAKPGEYTGTIRVTADGCRPVDIPIALKVYGVLIPNEKSMDTAYGGRPGGANYHSGNPEQMLAIDRSYEEMLHQHRLDYELFGVSPTFTFSPTGDLQSADWSLFDAVAGPRLSGDYWEDKVGMRRFCMDLGLIFPGNPYDKTPASKKKIIAQEVARHLKEKGWFKKTYAYCLDEPNEKFFPNIIDDIKLMREADKDWDGKFMCTTHATRDNPLLPYLNIWTVSTFLYENWSDYAKKGGFFSREDYAKLKERGNRYWLYVANYPTSGAYMSYQLDRLSCHEPRLLKWASYYEGASGFLFWCTMGSHAAVPNIYQNPIYTEDYRRDGKGAGVNGDAFLMYPGDRNGTPSWKYVTGHGVPFKPIDGPLPSIRLKQIRDGLEDWEMFLLAEKAGMRDPCRKEVEKVYTRLGGSSDESAAGKTFWSRDDSAMWAVRDTIARMIESR